MLDPEMMPFVCVLHTPPTGGNLGNRLQQGSLQNLSPSLRSIRARHAITTTLHDRVHVLFVTRRAGLSMGNSIVQVNRVGPPLSAGALSA